MGLAGSHACSALGRLTLSSISLDQCVGWVRGYADLISDNREQLTEPDAAIGGADHGINMDRGMHAVVEKLGPTAATAEELFKSVGMTLVSNVGGASGPLYGTFFLRLGGACGARDQLSMDEFVKAIRAGVEGLVSRGRPELGDKTMFDALHPALEALEAGRGFSGAWEGAVAGRDATIPMVARKGRASYLGERSAGHQDPGATSAALLFEAAILAFGEE